MKKNESKLTRQAAKKTLATPRLTRFGTLRDLTRAKLGMTGDSGMGQTHG